jgi:hypothetical protein
MAIQDTIDVVLAPLMESSLMTAALESMPTEDLVEVWTLLDFVYWAIDKRRKAMREHLLRRAEKYGRATDKGGQRLRVGGAKIVRQRRVGTLPEEAAVRKLLDEANIDRSRGFSTTTKVVVDVSKLEGLVNLGLLEEDAIEAAKKVSWALKVQPDLSLSSLLEEALAPTHPESTKTVRAKKPQSQGPRKGGA